MTGREKEISGEMKLSNEIFLRFFYIYFENGIENCLGLDLLENSIEIAAIFLNFLAKFLMKINLKLAANRKVCCKAF